MDSTVLAAEREFFETYCSRQQGVSCASALPALRTAVARGQTFERIAHWDPAANRLIAESLREALCEARPRLCAASTGAGP